MTTEFLELIQKISGVSFGVLLALILYGSYKGIWVWGRQLQKSETEAAEWKAMALRAAGLAETSVSIAKTSVRPLIGGQ